MYERTKVSIGTAFAGIQRSVPRPKRILPKKEVEHEMQFKQDSPLPNIGLYN